MTSIVAFWIIKCSFSLFGTKLARNQHEKYPTFLMIFQFCPFYSQKMQEKVFKSENTAKNGPKYLTINFRHFLLSCNPFWRSSDFLDTSEPSRSVCAAAFSETLPFFAEFLTFSITKHQIAFFHSIYQISFSWDIVKTSSKLRACLCLWRYFKGAIQFLVNIYFSLCPKKHVFWPKTNKLKKQPIVFWQLVKNWAWF